MSTLAVVATLDGWTSIKQSLQVSHGGRPDKYMAVVTSGLEKWLNSNGDTALAGINAATTALGGCATADELEQLQLQGLVDCGLDPSTGAVQQCPATCVPTVAATLLLVPFIMIAQVTLTIHLK